LKSIFVKKNIIYKSTTANKQFGKMAGSVLGSTFGFFNFLCTSLNICAF